MVVGICGLRRDDFLRFNRLDEDGVRGRVRCEGGGGSPNMKNLMKAKMSRARVSWPRKKARSAFILRGRCIIVRQT